MMKKADFQGVFPAITTKMTANQEVDLQGVKDDVNFQIDAGADGIIVCGSLGEASSLSFDEKRAIGRAAIEAAAGRKPIIATIAEDATRVGAQLAAASQEDGIGGLMVLPAMRYLSDTRETHTHFRAVAAASDLPIIVYNNPVAYTIDLQSADFAALADEPKFVAIKESSANTRRINDILRTVGERYQILTGVDDLALESLVLGCEGWIAGLVVAFPKETIAIYKLVRAGRINEALEIYRWFLPLLSLDIGAKFVQKIKLAEHIVRGTSPVVRAPRLALAGEEEKAVRAIVETGLKNRPDLSKYGV
ncbi:1-pyrroline-4-hydroxy-2-carboxylate deaminase [plant metagenome]|uniref:1-pyrroline-4-hydroxy-2-carboxylate deaminase n=2 Tax=root TaxID=1 RepID=A0A1C3K167_9BURK|nr:dihydrodipicolinate synthase family protein [Orrella dioscoreae]SBT25127.1 1-pyrroline-4-hydroxy-2-carboxylate deaminase [Orrella dioscoreae]SOE50780.1 1-pyrroline-4-hydroxy-2-carboxylate deaminase [Orrella dioscoreae]